MHKRGIIYIIIAIAALMLAIVFWFSFIADVPLLGHIKFEETVYGLGIEPYYDETEDRYYLFIPSYVKPGDITIDSSDFVNVSVSDETRNYGTDLSEVPLSQDITLTLTNFFQKETYYFQILQCETLPTVYIETESGSMDEVNADKNNEEDATVVVIDEDGTVEFSGLSSISGRGNSTWNGAKKPYNLKFDQMTDIIGTGEAKTWCLIANYIDPSQIRNALSYYAAREIGIEYTSKIEFVSLYINGEYLGLYNIATKQGYLEGIDSDITAVFDIRAGNESYDYATNEGTHIRVQYGEEEYVKSLIDNFETVLYNEDNFDVISQYIDVTSFAKKYCLETVLLNGDNQKSQYFAIDSSGKIKAICAWDYDHAFGISYYRYYDNSYNLFYISVEWYNRLFQYDEFREFVISIFNQHENSLKDSLINFMDNCYLEIVNDWSLNSIRWKHEKQLNESVYKLKCDPIYTDTLEGQLTYIRKFIKNRTEFLNSYWDDPEQFCVLTFSDEIIGNVSVYCKYEEILTKDMIPDGLLSIDENSFLGWYTTDGISVTDVETVTEDMTFYGAWENIQDMDRASDVTDVKDIDDIVVSDQSNDDNLIIAFMKKIYHGFGLDSFGIGRLAICGLFGLVLLGLLCVEIIRWIRQRRSEK